MAAKKKISTEEIKKKYGFDENEAGEKAFKSIIGITEDETVATDTKPTELKKRGRKKLENREKKRAYSFTVFPSIYDKARDKAESEGKTLSELVTEFLSKYGK